MNITLFANENCLYPPCEHSWFVLGFFSIAITIAVIIFLYYLSRAGHNEMAKNDYETLGACAE